MDWLRSEDLKEEKNITAPIIIIAVEEPIVVAKDYDAYHWAVSEKAGSCVWAMQRIRSDGEVSQRLSAGLWSTTSRHLLVLPSSHLRRN
jgi:hypothetical protein